MQILVHFLIVSSVLGFHKGFHKFIIGGVILMDCVSCLKHLALHYELGCGVFLFGGFKEVYRILGLFLLFGFGLKFLLSYHFRSGLLRFLCGLSGKSGNSSLGLSKFIDKIEMEKIENLNFCRDIDGQIDSDWNDEFDAKNNDVDGEKEYKDEDVESDITALRKMLKIEHQKLDAARAELVKERAASATAAEEAMAMILRLQNEKSLLEMEWSQYRRLAEEKQIHDQQVIKSLQWLVWQHELKRGLIEDDDEDDDDQPQPATPQTCFNGNILDALENVLYSSRDSDCFLSP
ncbi:protein FLOURY 1-like [Salvia miltiorrhiza]|uniref:protein FLOURY 1-like n=1 Tax=Salvia miltiorrhiza TaxID=226208 RepID=UPI0025ABBCB4|nr:protein FLOURY 1-like [Salvia miltiorrhiza]